MHPEPKDFTAFPVQLVTASKSRGTEEAEVDDPHHAETVRFPTEGARERATPRQVESRRQLRQSEIGFLDNIEKFAQQA